MLLSGIEQRYPKLRKLWADGGYQGSLIDWVKEQTGIVLEIVKRSDLKRFVVLPKRWIVERTFGWLNRYRRLSKDYELKVEHSRSMVQIAMIALMLNRLTP